MATYNANNQVDGYAPEFTEAHSYDSTTAQTANNNAHPNDASSNTVQFPSGTAALASPKMIVRYVLWIFAVIAFALMADSPHYSGSDTFSYVVAAGVLAWLWAFAMILVYFFRSHVDALCGFLPMAEMAVDGILFVMTFIGACVAASKCQGDYEIYCDYYNKPHASVAFLFLTSFVFIVALIMDWFENKKIEGATA